MSKKQTKEIKGLSKDELQVRQRELEKKLFDVKLKKVTGQLEDTAQPWRLRKELARVKTFLSQAAAK